MPPAQFDLPWEQFRKIKIPLPSVERQRATTDYLDAETARIDDIMAKKRRLLELLEERRSALFEEALRGQGVDLVAAVSAHDPTSILPQGWRVPALGRVLRQLTNGYVGPTRDLLVDKGVKYIQGLHIKRGLIDFERYPFYVPYDWHVARPRISLQPGDVLIVQTGDIGQAAVVPDDFGPASCHALLIARPNTSIISSEYLGVYLQSTVGHNELLRLATGALHPHLEFGIKKAPILMPPPDKQRIITEHVTRSGHTIDEARVNLLKQIHLLQEHRQALITAAVTQVDLLGEGS